MKKELLAMLTTMFASMGFSAATLDGVADYLSKTVTEADKVEEAVKGSEALLKLFQSDADRRAQAAADKARKEKAEEKKEETQGGSTDKKQEGTENESTTDKLLKQLMEKLEKQDNEIAAIKSGKTAETRQQTLEAKLKDAPANFKALTLKNFGRMKFDTDDEFNDFLTDTEQESKNFVQQEANHRLRGTPRPLASSGAASKEASKEEVDDVMKLM